MTRIADLIDGRAAAAALIIGVLALLSSAYFLQDQTRLLFEGVEADAKVTKKWQETRHNGRWSRELYLIAYQYQDQDQASRSVAEFDLALPVWRRVEVDQPIKVAYDPKNADISVPVDHLKKGLPLQLMFLSISFCVFLVGVTLAWVKFLDWKRKVDVGVA